MRRAAFVAGAAFLVFGLAACSGVQKQLGMGKQSPDEFRVASQAPLSLPPDYRLRPPEPGAVRPQEGTPTQRARSSVFKLNGADGATPVRVYGAQGAQSAGERALTQRAGADRVDPQIRQMVELETEQINEDSNTFLDNLIFWRDPEPTGNVVDARAESDRLRENRALNRPVNTGETPVIKRRQRGILEGVFD
ncbi:MAG: DUF3035 domain-containing protein [Kiloniellales bacterium]|nr:DUF3035 domain-containing protein [Kiloniellales bacterium]